LTEVCQDSGIQTDFGDYRPERYRKECRLDAVIDQINRTNGRETVVLAARQYPARDGKDKAVKFADAIRRDRKSPEYTTRWSDILEAE
jgi:DNA polymerase V